LDCEVLGDGTTVQVDADTIHEPDALVRCGATLGDNATRVLDPLILVEVVSPSSRARDSGGKLEDYFRMPPVRHYLIVKTKNRAVIQYERDAAGAGRPCLVVRHVDDADAVQCLAHDPPD
jgi:Uma2 family endonuclease